MLRSRDRGYEMTSSPQPSIPHQQRKSAGAGRGDGAYRGIGMPKTATAEQRKKMSDLWRALNADAEMKELAAKSGFELVNVGVEQMEAFMAEKTKLYTEAAKRLDFSKK